MSSLGYLMFCILEPWLRKTRPLETQTQILNERRTTMKTLSTLSALALAGFFAASVQAGTLSSKSYEDYVQSGSWPTDSSSQQSPRSIADISQMVEDNPTAIGHSHFEVRDLFGGDIYGQ